jgi:hypothetical protein
MAKGSWKREARKRKDEARKRGLKYYFTGRACRRGHVAWRYVSCGKCVDCAPVEVRGWNAANKRRQRENARRWRAKNPDYQKEWHAKNPSYKKEWRAKRLEHAKSDLE